MSKLIGKHMSLDASAYTANTRPLSRDELSRAVGELGWVLQFVNDIFEPSRFRTISGGMLADGDYVYGWRADDRHFKEYEQALRLRDVAALERWAQEDPDHELGAAFVYIHPYEHDNSPSEDDALRDEMGVEYVQGLKSAKLEYVIELHANNDDFRIDLTQIICRRLGGLVVHHSDR